MPLFWPIFMNPFQPFAQNTRRNRLNDLETRMNAFIADKRSTASDNVIDNVRASRAEVRSARSGL